MYGQTRVFVKQGASNNNERKERKLYKQQFKYYPKGLESRRLANYCSALSL